MTGSNKAAAVCAVDSSATVTRTPDASAAAARTLCEVPAREVLFEEPAACPVYPWLMFDGFAIDEHGQYHLIVSYWRDVRIYIGPDDETVRRRARIVVAALCHQLENKRAEIAQAAGLISEAAGGWIEECWEALMDEVPERRRRHGGPLPV